MTLKQAAQKAIDTNNIELFSSILDQMRFKLGLDYLACADLWYRMTAIDLNTFESLCYEADALNN